MIETIGLSALNEIKAIPGFENAVIAGGAVRDRLLGGPIKDLDIFIPCSNEMEFRAKLQYKEQPRIQSYDSERMKYVWNKIEPIKFGNFSHMNLNLTGYHNKGLTAKIDCLFMGKVECDLVAYRLPNDEKFGENVVKDFCYHIDQAYYDGRDIVTTKQFDRDAKFHEATLWYLKKIEDLPNALEKFRRLQAKYPEFTWRQTCLELKEKEVKNKTKTRTKEVTGQAIVGAWIDEGIDFDNIQAREEPVNQLWARLGQGN